MKQRTTIDKPTAMMALMLSETMHLAKAMKMPKEELLKELKELSDYTTLHPIFLTEPGKWVRLNALFIAATYRKIIKTGVPPLTCVQQHMMQERIDQMNKQNNGGKK